MLLGWAEHLRTSGGGRGWRWLALSPLLFAAILFSRPLDLVSIFEDGVGGGAIGVPLLGMAGGYALSGRGPLWARIASGVVALSIIPILRRSWPGTRHAAGRMGCLVLLLVHGHTHARLRHPASSGVSPMTQLRPGERVVRSVLCR
jgi:hypothetical protein